MPEFPRGPVQVSPRQAQVPLSVPRREAPKSTDRSPTLNSLMNLPEAERTMRVRVPWMTKVARVKFDSIWLNTWEFKPGTVHKLHPIVAKELLRAIDNFEQVPMRQMTGNVEENTLALKDVQERERFEKEEQALRLADALEEARVGA